MKLVIVESPTKAKTIGAFLGKEYKVESSYGHVRDLPKSKLGIDVEDNFLPSYIVPVKAKKLVTALKKEAAKAETVILATDEDREGEAIAWHLSEALKLEDLQVQSTPTGKPPKLKNVERIVFHEITKHAIEEALTHPRKIDLNMVDAQQARRVLDRLVGYKLSPFLWKKVAAGLSAGRVQSVTLRLIVDRENEIRAFKPEEYWTIMGRFEDANNAEKNFEANLVKIGGKALDKFAIKTSADAEKISETLRALPWSITSVKDTESKKSPHPPFTTSTLQQEGAKRLHYSSKKTMLLAQRLYEEGLITYMRTDSVNLSTESTTAAKSWLSANLGERYASEAPRSFKVKSKLAQEAHEAIRPTDPTRTPDQTTGREEAERKVYALIWKRFMASQMPQAIVATRTIEAEGTNGKDIYTFRATGQRIVFDGFLKYWEQKLEEKELPDVHEGDAAKLTEVKPSQHFTEPPPRYSEATLVKTLEENGIGRPSTYAPTISVIQTRNYVIKDAGRFKPTDIGELVSKVLTEHFPAIVDIGFTAQMEDELDDIARGIVSWQSVMQEFYEPFAKLLAEKYAEVSKEEVVPEKTNEICDKCGKPMVVKMSRFGKFLGCSGFPECKNLKKLSVEAGGKPGPKPIGMKCPKCTEGEIVERHVTRGRARGKLFWGCARYPKCDYASWEDPRGESAPKPEKVEEKDTEE
jgi:DNA topoisomerase-1